MATNSIIIANLPDWSANTQDTKRDGKPETLSSTFIDSLRTVIEVHRDIVHWVPVRRWDIFETESNITAFVEYSAFSLILTTPRSLNAH